MRLKQIKLAGFKSFVDPTSVTLPGNRCAVVGPNGCGKSNIIDAVRWVMGESSAKQLRGENLTDVIFNGSGGRKPTAVASIELFFDNSDGRIGGEYASYAEIAIRRQVTRDGQSTYFLNGSKCRRRDIQDIFLGTGFGPRSYSIIEQGMISQLVEAKPEELRVYLEEAAGISKYKERRRETENRIKHTRENLERINDIREELARQLDRLQRQSQAAAKYRELRADESLLTAQLFVLKHTTVKAELEERDEAISALRIELEKKLAEQRRLESEIEAARAEHAGLSESFNTVQGNYYSIGSDIARLEETIQFNQTRIKQLQEDLESVEQRTAESIRQLDMDEKQIEEVQTQIRQLTPEVQVLLEEVERCQERLEETETRVGTWQADWDAFNATAARNDREAEVQASRIDHLRELLARLRRRQDELGQQASAQPVAATDTVDALAEEIASLERNAAIQDVSIDENMKPLSAAREEVMSREQSVDEARSEVQTLRHELATLQAVQEAALGQHVKEADDWLAAHSLEEASRLGDTLAVVAGWELAVETVLGEFLRALRIDNLDAVASSLAELADGELALIDKQMPRPAAVNAQIGLPTLASLVRGESSSDNGTGSLLSGVYAADSATTALENRRHLNAGESIITRDGVWIGADWMRVLHSADEQSGIIERGQQIETLTLRVEEAEHNLAEMQTHVRAGRTNVEHLEGRREELQQRANQLSGRLGQLRTDHGVTQVKVEEAESRKLQIEKERADLADQIQAEEQHLEAARQSLAQIEGNREGQDERRQHLADAKTAIDAELASVRTAARESREKYHERNVQKEGRTNP